MAWFKVDDHLTSHPAACRVGDDALGLWMRIGCWLAQFPNHGDEVPEVVVDMLLATSGRRKRAKVAALVDAGMLIPIGGGYRMYRGLDICGSHLGIRAWDIELPPTRRPSIPSWMRSEVIARDGLTCQLCYGEVDTNDIHLDHVLPFSMGGATDPSNLQVAHSRCNMSKGARV